VTRDFCEGDPIGILRGPTSRGTGMDVVAPYLPDPPARGDFALVPAAERALVLRIVGAHPTGSFSESSDRGADYLSHLARQAERVEVPERVRELLLRFRLEAVPLGWLEQSSGRWRFEPGVRTLQLFGHPVFRPSVSALRVLVNAGLEHEPEGERVKLGVLARGHERRDEVPVDFSIRRLKGRRSFVFARAGYGKSNLVKLLLSRIYQAPPDVGLLIIDPEGEYAFTQTSESNRPIRGLLDHPSIRDRVKVFTRRNPSLFPAGVRRSVAGDVRLDIGKLSPEEFLFAFVPAEKQAQVWANRVRSERRGGFAALVELLRRESYRASDKEIGDALGFRASTGKAGEGGDVSIQAIRNNVIPVIRRFDGQVDLVGDTVAHLDRAGVVVLDVSCLGASDADAIVRIVLHRIFESRVEAFTTGASRKPGVLMVLEEAQAVLGDRTLDNHDIYVRWVKEGRKYGLGALMITQQPGAISSHLVSQGDNFFAMHLLAQRDLDVLGAANAHYTPEILEFLRTEPVKGNCYFWSAPDQPYVVGVRIDNYDEAPLVKAELTERAQPLHPGPALDATPLERAVATAICTSPRVFVMSVASVNGAPAIEDVAVARDFLASNIPDARALAATGGAAWIETSHGPKAPEELLDSALGGLGLLSSPARATAKRRTKGDLPVFLLRKSSLESVAKRFGLPAPAVKADNLVCVE
jgi:DNA helicase HerA-like ATPase